MLRPENSSFSLGVNYPWHHYGQDFGCLGAEHRGVSKPDVREIVAREFAAIQETGATVVRWFLFGDGRAGFRAENGIARKPDDFLFADVAAALEVGERKGLKLCFSLIDFLWLQEHGGKRPRHAHEHVLQFAAGREAFLQNVLIPLFREFRGGRPRGSRIRRRTGDFGFGAADVGARVDRDWARSLSGALLSSDGRNEAESCATA